MTRFSRAIQWMLGLALVVVFPSLAPAAPGALTQTGTFQDPDCYQFTLSGDGALMFSAGKSGASVQDAHRLVAEFVDRYNNVRLHSAIGYVAPVAALEGRAEAIQTERQRKLEAAQRRRKRKSPLTQKEPAPTLHFTSPARTSAEVAALAP